MSSKINNFTLPDIASSKTESAMRALVRSHAIHLCTDEYTHNSEKTLEATIDEHVASLFL